MYMNTFVYMNMLIAKKEGKGTPAPKGGIIAIMTSTTHP
jgi:hypothetical protein